MTGQPSFCGVILAAGTSSRMGRDKALLPWPAGSARGTFLSGAMDAVGPATERVIVVAGENEAALRAVVYARAGYLVVNPDPSAGQFSSLQIGLRAVLDSGHDGAVVMLVDRPPVKVETIRRLQEGLGAAEDVWACVPEYKGEHGHPIVMGRDLIEAILRAPASSTAKEVRAANEPRIRYVPVDDKYAVLNVNTPEEYEQASLKTTGDPAS
jgi:molybdenum cofactor cytidylyltransferase